MNRVKLNDVVYPKFRFEESRPLVFSAYGNKDDDIPLLQKAYKKILNISFEHVFCIDADPEQICENVDIYPVKLLSSFENFDVWYPRSVSRPTDKIIISIPKRITEKPLAIISMDKATYVLLLLSFTVFSVLFAISYAVYGKFKRRTRRRRRQELLIYSLANAYNLFGLIFREPFPSLYKLKFSERILVNSWLIALIFLSAIINCYLNSEFCKEEYLFYETEDDIENFRVRPLFARNEMTFYDKFVSRHPWVSKYDPEVIINYVTAADEFINLLSSPDEPTALILSDNTIRTNEYFNPAFKDAGITYHVSKLQFEYNVYGINTSLIADCELDERLTLGFQIFFETKPLTPFEMKPNLWAESVLWKPPVKSNSAIKFNDIYKLFNAYIYGLLIASLVLIVELLIRFCT